MKKSKSASPRTVQELVPWFNAQIGQLKNEFRELIGVRPDALPPVELPSREAQIELLVGSLHQAVSQIELLLRQSTTGASTNEIASDLARALILSGNGQHFEPAIRSAIQAYCDTHEEEVLLSRREDLPASIREDILAGLQRIAANQKHDLELLGVETQSVEPGEKLDVSCHQVVEQLETSSSETLETVSYALTPVFRWAGAQTSRIQPARVIAYTNLTPDVSVSRDRSETPREQKSPLLAESSSIFDTE